LAAGHEVTVFDSLVTGHRQAVPEGAQFIQADLSDHQALFEALRAQEYAAVMHFAAFIEAGESMRDPGKYFQNNAINSLWLLEACVQAGVRRFVYSSSAAVYASSDEPLTEEAPLRPSNIYGQTKLMTETLLEWYRQARGLGYAALRYFNAAGGLPDRGEAHQPETHLIPLVLQVALGRRPGVKIFGTDYPTPDGTCVRDYIHVADLVSAHLLALEALEPEVQLIYNVGSGAGYSVRQVIETARQVTGHPLPAEEAPRRPGDPPRLVANSDKIRRELDWTPQHPSLDDIIASAWEWHRSHPTGYGV
jgi:UDP-glucose 4-epimerase